MSQQDWWAWQGSYWQEVLSGQTVTADGPDPDPDDPDPERRYALLVTATGTLSAGNEALRTILADDGWTVTVSALGDPVDFVNFDVIVLVDGGASDTGRFLFPSIGIVAVDSWREVGMGTGLGFAVSNDLEVVDSSSPLAAGYVGTFDAYQTPNYITWEPNSYTDMQTVVTRAGQPSQRVVFAYEAGTQMPGRYATTRHVGLGYHQDGFVAGLSATTRAQFLAAVRWARDTTVASLPVPSAPTGVSAAAGDGQVRLSWTASQYAETYSVRRAAVTGGPYTEVASLLPATTYTDTGLTNTTAYFYVVAAKNGTGQSANSAEVTATPTVTSVENLSLMVSTSEVAMWRDRAQNGPFQTASDFSTNSPGHWLEMVADSTTDWSTARWTGPQEINADGSVKKLGQTSGQTSNDPPGATQQMGLKIAAAAYVAVANDDVTLAQNVMDEVRWYSQQSRLNFANTTLYPDNHFGDLNPLFIIALWVTQLMKAYDACRALLPQDTGIENWFVALASVCHGNLQSLSSVFPNRGSDDYTSRASLVDNDLRPSTLLANGNVVQHLLISQFYNNRRNELASAQGFAGLIGGSTFHVDWAKRYFREWVMFANRTTANQWTSGDHDRGADSFPQLSFTYDMNSMQGLVLFMEALARSGDTSLYDFSSSEGSANATWGSNHLKTMKEVLEQRIDTIDRTIVAMYTGSGSPPSSTQAGDPFYRIQSRVTSTNREIVTDGWLMCAAGYYNEPTWADVVLRVGTPSGFTNPPQPAGPVGGWSVDQRTRFLRSYDSSPFT